jgi:hypothetical protein
MQAPTQGASEAAATIPGRAIGLAYDDARHGLWYLVQTDAGTDLSLFDIATSTPTSMHLPAVSNDDYRRLAAAPDGAIWVASGYTLLRVDPTTQSIQRRDLALKVTGMLPGALGEAGSSPGTWISAMTFSAGGELLLARNNVPFLQVVTPAMGLTETIPLPAGLDGLSAMALGPAGLAYRLHGSTPAGTYETVKMPLTPPAHPQLLLTDSAAPRARLSVVGPDNRFIIFDMIHGTLTWSPGGQTPARQLYPPSERLQIVGPRGTPSTVTGRAHIVAATFDGSGGMWYIQTWQGRTQLMRAQ